MNIALSITKFRRTKLNKYIGNRVVAGAEYAGLKKRLSNLQCDVEQISLAVPNLPAELAGLCLAQISDIHLGEHFHSEQLYDAVTVLNQLAPDYVLMTGDYVTDHVRYAQGLIEPLRHLHVPAFAVLGNHDCYCGAAEIAQALAATPVQLMRNQALELHPGFWLAGLDDILRGRPNLAATLRPIPQDAATVLMVHEPDFFNRVVQEQIPIHLQLSGHTHGGQIRIPKLRASRRQTQTWAPVLPSLGRQYSMGLYSVGQRYVYINRGLGFTGWPIRFNCRPEITLITLEQASPKSA
ncbi:MAG: metallophosphoesterase [Caldilineaceae bacterium]